MEILFLVHRIPFPPDKGDKIRSYHWLNALAARHVLHLGCFIDDPEDRRYLPELRRRCASLHAVSLSSWQKKLRAVRGVLGGAAVTASVYRDRGFAAWVKQRFAADHIRCVIAYSSAMAGYVGPWLRPEVGRILDFVDADAEKWRLLGERTRGLTGVLYRREALRLIEHDRKAVGCFNIATFVSAAEAERFQAFLPERVRQLRVLRNGVDARFFTPELESANPYGSTGPIVAFTGIMNYWPNEEAVIWFATSVLPRLRADIPSLRFAIVGRSPSSRVQHLASLAGVRVVGGVADIRPYLAHAAAVVVPLRVAIGVPNKILEAMAMARPVIASPEAVRGVDFVPGRELMIAHAAEDFATAVRDALAGGPRITAMARQARQRVLLDYDWETVERQMQRMVGEIGGASPALRRGAIA
jgi:sugar transferase (PEP-CTERM/EpsH1 system associated)